MEVPGHSYPCLAEARWWFVAHRLYQLGAYVNPVYTLIWVGFALRSTPRHCCISPVVVLRIISVERTFPPVPAKKPDRQFNVGEKVRVNLHHAGSKMPSFAPFSSTPSSPKNSAGTFSLNRSQHRCISAKVLGIVYSDTLLSDSRMFLDLETER